MASWVDVETKTTTINDKRLEKRFARLLEQLSEKPDESIPAACQGWSDTQAAYRFLDNDKVGFDDIIEGHRDATIERIGQQHTVLLVQDTTFLDYGVEEAVGLGTLRHTPCEQYLLHPTVAFTPSRVNLGVLGAAFWQRPEKAVRHLRRQKPIEEKESYRWLQSYRLACEVQRQCADTLVVSVADREGDIHEWFVDAQQREVEDKAEFVIRAKSNRRTSNDEDESSYLWDDLAQCAVIGTLCFKTPRTGNKKSRAVTVEIRTREVEFCGRHGGARVPPVTVSAVYVNEQAPPKGEEPIEWMLLTSVPVPTRAVAEMIVGWYRCRWEIEIFFRVLKQGCTIEKLRLETDQRLLNGIAIYLIIAWRIHTITMRSREQPKARCDVVFSEKEWKTIYLMKEKKKPPKQPPPLRTITRMLAQLGGFLARKGDGEPGIKNIWRGYRCLKDYIDALDVAQVAL